MGITNDYVDFCLGLKYEDLPPEVVEYVKRLGLDFVGTAAYGALADSSKVMLEFIQSLNLRGDCTVIGVTPRYPPQYAALANGAFVKPNELDDVENSSSLHPGAPVWPVILALGEKCHADGKELITAAVVGYETIIRLGQAINYAEHYKRGFHPSSTCGHFAATLAASKLLGLNKRQTVDALGITGSQTSGSFRYIVAGSWTKAFHSGWASHNGILAANLAQKGFNGPTDIFEGQYGFLESYSQNTNPELLLKDLGKVYQTLRTGIKIHTACRHEHPALDAILALMRQNGIRAEDIKRVDIYLIGNAFRLVVEPEKGKRAPQNVVESMHSMYFGAAMAILKGRAFIEEHTEAWLRAPQVRDLVKKIYCHHDPDLDELLPEKFPARAVILTTDGKRFEETYEVPHGDGLNPLPLDELREKYEPLARSVFSEKRVHEIEESLMRLEEIKDFTQTAELLCGSEE
ncbi:MmgE/PrpD family protein [Nitrospinota bacterium]